MDSPLAAALRESAADALPEGAFLRRDRGGALYVTNAPRLRPDVDWKNRLHAAGFRCESRDGLMRLWPGAAWLDSLEQAWPEPPDALCQSLVRFRAMPPEDESLALFAHGAQALEAREGGIAYGRALRRRAALCLRLNRTEPDRAPRGGGLYACALLHHIIMKEEVL